MLSGFVTFSSLHMAAIQTIEYKNFKSALQMLIFERVGLQPLAHCLSSKSDTTEAS